MFGRPRKRFLKLHVVGVMLEKGMKSAVELMGWADVKFTVQREGTRMKLWSQRRWAEVNEENSQWA